MPGHSLSAFLLVVVTVVLVPGPDFALTLRNTIVGGRRRGWWTAAGIGLASMAQGAAVALGLGVVIVQAQPVFQAIRWAGVAYLVWLGLVSLRSAARGEYALHDLGASAESSWVGFRQGVLCNVTNPKILVFFLALLPQFVGRDESVASWVAHAWLLPIAGTIWLALVVALVALVRVALLRRTARRVIDAVTGTVLVGFGVRLATDH